MYVGCDSYYGGAEGTCIIGGVVPGLRRTRRRAGAMSTTRCVAEGPGEGRAGSFISYYDDASDLGVVGVAPVCLGLWLNTARTAEDADTTVEHFQGAIDLNREVHVSRGIDDVEAVVIPETSRCSGLNGDPALLLLIHEVSRSRTIMHLTDLMNLTGELENALGRGGLAGIDVGEDADVSVAG